MQQSREMYDLLTEICTAHGHNLIDALEQGEHIHVRLDNPPYLPLVIETPYPNTISVTHYGTMNGDAMCDPEVLIWVNPTTKQFLPYAFRNDYTGTNREYIQFEDGQPVHYSRYWQKDVAVFCKTWAKNIREQGFV